mgnify:CR=1 FL=1
MFICGSPETVRQKLDEYHGQIGFGHLLSLLQFGTLPAELTRKNMELYANEVIPHLRAGAAGALELLGHLRGRADGEPRDEQANQCRLRNGVPDGGDPEESRSDEGVAAQAHGDGAAWNRAEQEASEGLGEREPAVKPEVPIQRQCPDPLDHQRRRTDPVRATDPADGFPRGQRHAG